MKLEQADSAIFSTEINSITVLYIYIDENNEVYSIKKTEEDLEDNCFSKERQLYIIKEAQYNLQKKHKLTSLGYFNIDIEQDKIQDLIDNKLEHNFFHVLDILDSINFKKTLRFLHDHASVFYIFKYISSSVHNTTRRVTINDNKNVTRKSRIDLKKMHIEK
jgi:hypothetical protein